MVDGVIQEEPLSIDVSSQLTGNMAELIGNEISWLNPLDIENITVLKMLLPRLFTVQGLQTV